MIEFRVNDYSCVDWDQMILGAEGQSLIQSWEYGAAKADTGPWRVERGEFVADGHIIAVCQILLRDLPLIGGGLAWVNRGPLVLPAQSQVKEVNASVLIDALATNYCDQGAYYLRLAPPTVFAPASSKAKATETLGWASATIDLSIDIETLRKNLNQKWRNCLNKAERLSLEVREGTDQETFAHFLKAHDGFLKAAGFDASLDSKLLACLQDHTPESRKMTALLAFDKGDMVGSVLIAKFGETCEYLAGNSTDHGRKNNVGQLLLWNAIVAMKDQGFKQFDVGGMDEFLTPSGILRFKKGLGGVPYRLANELESINVSWRGKIVRSRVQRARKTL